MALALPLDSHVALWSSPGFSFLISEMIGGVTDFIYLNFWLCWVFTAVHGLSLVAVGGLFTVMASLVVEHRL